MHHNTHVFTTNVTHDCTLRCKFSTVGPQAAQAIEISQSAHTSSQGLSGRCEASCTHIEADMAKQARPDAEVDAAQQVVPLQPAENAAGADLQRARPIHDYRQRRQHDASCACRMGLS